MNKGTTLLCSDSEMASRIRKSFVKNCHATFDKKMKLNCNAFKPENDDLFKNRSKISTFVTRPFLTMINLEENRLSLQQLEYEMDCTDHPVDYSYCEI